MPQKYRQELLNLLVNHLHKRHDGLIFTINGYEQLGLGTLEKKAYQILSQEMSQEDREATRTSALKFREWVKTKTLDLE